MAIIKYLLQMNSTTIFRTKSILSHILAFVVVIIIIIES